MIRILATALLFASGCSVVRVDEMPMDGTTGAVELKALRSYAPEDRTTGYEFRVKGKRVDSGWIPARRDAPCLLPDLRPGDYTVEVRGRGIDRKRFEIEVRPGVRTSIAVLRKNVKRNERIAETAETVAVGAATGLVYTVGLVGYAIVWVIVEGCDNDNDADCGPSWESSPRGSCDSSPRRRSTATERPPQGYRSRYAGKK